MAIMEASDLHSIATLCSKAKSLMSLAGNIHALLQFVLIFFVIAWISYDDLFANPCPAAMNSLTRGGRLGRHKSSW